MQENSTIVKNFFDALGRLDDVQLNNCYSDDIIYSDPLFGLLKGEEVKAMWKMVCTHAKNIQVEYFDFEDVDHEYVTCRWKTSYYFEPTHKQIFYDAKAFMKIYDGKIIEHSDGYRFSSWLGKNYGWAGTLFGWTGFMKRRVQKQYRQALNNFIR